MCQRAYRIAAKERNLAWWLNFLILSIMKTIADLFELIINETNANDGKLVKYTFSVDTHHNWVSMYEKTSIEGHESKEIFTMESIKTPEQLQQVYWTIYNNGRSSKQV